MLPRIRILMLTLLAPLGVLHVAAAERPIVVCSTTQVADFARQVVGDRWEVRSVLAAGQDPHLYEVRPRDFQSVRDATLCLENGLHLEGRDWMQALAMDAGVRLVRCTEGIQKLILDEGEESIPDPHAWFSTRNAMVYVENIRKVVSELDPSNAAEYSARADLYRRQLQALHAWILRTVNVIPANRRILVTSHDAFNYFCRDYGFQAAAPTGWSTGAEVGAGPTLNRRRETVESIRKFGVRSIFVETSVKKELILEIAEEAGVEVGGTLYSDSMGAEGTAGETYIGMMRENVIKIVSGLAPNGSQK